MVDLAPLVATAQRLIEENGREVTLIAFDKTNADPNKPWDNNPDPRAVPDVSLTLFVAFVDPGSASALGLTFETADLTKIPQQIGLASPGLGVDLTPFQEMIDGTDRWKIIQLDVLKPGAQGTALNYLSLRQ